MIFVVKPEVTIIIRVEDANTGDIFEIGKERVSPDSIFRVCNNGNFLKEKVSVGNMVKEIVITMKSNVEFIFE